MNLKTNLLALLLLIIGTVALNAQTQTPVAVYTGECGSQYYRIPAIVTANNGDLLFFNDDRHTSNKDVGSNTSSNGIDLLVKRLNWNGTAYGSVGNSLNITSNKSPLSKCYGDPAVVADRESDEVLVLAIGGTQAWTSNTTSYSIRSYDNGQTWEAPVSLALPTATNNSNVAGFFFASGRILQSKVIKKQGASYYRIYSAILSYERDNANSSYTNRNRVFYSDDFGRTWNLLGSSYAQTSADEAKLEELPNGDLILTTRKSGGRYINKYTYTTTETADGSWDSPGQSYDFTGGCAINADMLTMTAYRTSGTSDSQQVTLLLLSTATGSSRTDIKIFYHEIDNNTTVASLTSGWTETSFTLPNTSTFGGYSAMTMQADDKIGVYYEGNTDLCTLAGNDFSNLYYIAYTLEQLTGNAYTLTDPNPPVVVVPDVEVPDGIVPIYQWQGTNSDRWSDPLNWTVINAVNNTPLARGMVPPTPNENSNVKILAPGANEFNPVLETQLPIKNLYVAPGAAIGNQYLLQVGEKVYTDVEIPTNQWVRMSMPLRDTYSGDMYTTEQGGVIPTDDFFAGATYNPTGGNTGNNRVFPYAIYQRVFSDAVNVMTDDQTGTELHQLNSSWSVPYNDLAAKYQVAEGFDLWAPSTEATATFRFPSATDEYAYYYSNGNASTRKEAVNHTASGTMAYGNSGNGVMDVTLTRASRANGTDGNGVPMYAVGNPSFSYLDIAEFIRVNAYGASHSGDASVVGNITPYVYKYDEGENLNGGEASETIYYLDNDKKLHKVTATAAVSNTTMPDNSTLEDAGRVYVAPTRGFRVMAGQAEVSAVEPKLIGNYNTSTFKLADLRYSTNASMSNATTNTYFYVSSVPHSSTGIYTSSLALTVAVGSSADEVVMSGFCYSSILRGKVDPVAQTITVASGTPVGYQFEGSTATWKDPSNTGANNRKIYAWDGTTAVSSSAIGGYYVDYADGLSADNPLVFDYTIAQDGSVTITARSGFAIYTGDGSCPLSYMELTPTGQTVSHNYPLALNAYESFTATASRETAEENYINPDMFGTYNYLVVNNKNTPGVTTGNTYTFSISPVEGSYNAVRVSNFFAGTATSKDDILGYISEGNGQYTLTIPGSQVAANGTSNNFADFYGFYKRGRAGDVVLDWDGVSKTLNLRDYNVKGTIQVSGFDANPNGSTFLGYYANGLNLNSGSGTPSLSANQIDSDMGLRDRTIQMKYSNSYIGYNGSKFSTTNSPSFSDDTYLFEFVPSGTSGNVYLIKNRKGYYYSAGTTSSWVTASQNAAACTIEYSNSGWTIKVNNRYLYLSGGSLTTTTSARYWTFYDVSTAGNVIPQTAPYTGVTSGGSADVQFQEGTNYEAINLKFTANMFKANPGSSSSASSAPRKTAAQGSTMASVKLVDGDRTANTLITRRDNGHNGYNAFEDASLIDVNDNAKSIATLAGNQMVAVNTLGDTTAVQLVLNNANGNVALTFDNLAALGSNARLFDATTGSETPLDANHEELTVNMTVNDSPLRYSIIWDVVSGTEEVELPMTDGDLWFKAFSSAKGTIKVTSSENMASVRLYDSTGKLVGSKVNAQNETMFEYLLSGIYVVEVSNGAETQSMKVNVK